LKSSSIIGGANGINYLVGLVRMKIVAILLGPSGVGLVGTYIAITGMLAALTGLGIGSSGVREIAESTGTDNGTKVAATAKTILRISWMTGVFGWGLCAALSRPISTWVFGTGDHAVPIAVLGSTLFLGAICGGQTALLQGTRRIGDLARIQVISLLLNTAVTLGLYGWLREQGIIPVLVVTSVINLSVSWRFARPISPGHVSQPWRETFGRSKELILLGLAFMWGGLLTAVVGLGLRAVIIRDLGLDANGVYQAAWGISGMFAGFILGAMGTDFYPRLTAVAADNEQVNRLVNEQTEIGILLALPGLLATLAFAPWIMHLFYSATFVSGGELLPWFVLGIFGQVVSWPMGFILLAKGEKIWFAASETLANLLKLGVSIFFMYHLGLVGIAIAYPALYLVQTIWIMAIALRITGFRWSAEVAGLLGMAGVLIIAGFAATFLPGVLAPCGGTLVTVIASILAFRGLGARLGHSHRLVTTFLRIPGMQILLR
jgi:antigen flippase